MKKMETLYSRGAHEWRVIARDPERSEALIDTNEYLVAHGREALLTDPGGLEIFPMVFSALTSGFDPRRVKWIFASHQDPDVISSLSLWLEFNPELRCYASHIWDSFLPHYGGGEDTFVSLPDEGAAIPLGGIELQAIPAHYLHSPGNFHLYDAKARILFSGDVGAALAPAGEDALFVTDFARHIRHAQGFHARFMGSREAVLDWCERAAALEIDMLCPQHGSIYQGADVMRFINWFSELEVGVGLRQLRSERREAA